MYCSACGANLDANLRFCNRCGTQLVVSQPSLEKKGAPLKLTDLMQYLALATCGVVGGGLFFTLIIIKVMLKHGNHEHAIMFLAALCLLTVFGVAALLIRQLSRLLTVYLQGVEETAPPA